MFHRMLLITLLVTATFALPGQSPQKPMTNQDVVAMVKNALPESVILDAIRADQTAFDVSAPALITLHKAGVSQRILQAMISASGGNERAAKPRDPQSNASTNTGDVNPAATASQPTVTCINGQRRINLAAEPTEIASTKAKATSLAALAADALLEQALQVGTQVAQNALIRSGSSAGSTAFSSSTSVVSSILGRRKQQSPQQQKTTYVWALSGGSSSVVVGNGAAFEVTYSGLPGVDPDGFEPVIVKLAITRQANFRLVGATEGTVDAGHDPQHDWPIYSSFVEDRVRAKVQKLGSGRARIVPAAALPSGQYGVALRPIDKTHKFSGEDVGKNQGEGLLFNYVWPFSVN
jgi:hypothetical protein